MTNNDILRSIRYMLDLGDPKVAELAKLADADLQIDKEVVQRFLKKEDDANYLNCSDRVLACFLDGLVIQRRGRNESQPARAIESRISNNIVLKKLRIAFTLRDEDMHAIFAEAGFPLSKPELSALFRQPGHKHYRACGDQILRNFLKGLTSRQRDAH